MTRKALKTILDEVFGVNPQELATAEKLAQQIVDRIRKPYPNKE